MSPRGPCFVAPGVSSAALRGHVPPAVSLLLTGALRVAGLVARVIPAAELVDTAVAMGEKIASKSQPVVQMCKEAVNASYELTLAEGVRFERRLFHATFATKDQKEGMGAFIEKRDAEFTHE